jgi:very-long-chain enoyl-CoA reductase
MKLKIKSRSGTILTEVDLPESASVNDLKVLFHKLNPKFYPQRQRFTLENVGERRPIALQDGKKLSDYGLKDGDCVVFKDLGSQFSWATVYTWEYLGPLFLYLLFYLRPVWIYGSKAHQPHLWQQEVAAFCWCFHFTKRILETHFVHVFSRETMGLYFLIRNCIYYWVFGIYIGYYVNHPLYTPVTNPNQFWLGVCAFFVFELLNGWCHLQLRLQRRNAKEKIIPRGFWFSFVSFPNYFFEVLSWVAFNVMTQTVAGVLFTVVGAFIMTSWALQKHAQYKKIFDGKDGKELYPKRRKAMWPFIL